jgi:mono/diheme cytochrome c family protein
MTSGLLQAIPLSAALRRWAYPLAGLLAALSGCGQPEARFSLNKVYLRKMENEVNVEVSTQHVQAMVDTLAAMFGTPDEPHFVQDSAAGTAGFLDMGQVVRAAGPVATGRATDLLDPAELVNRGEGLYREHCVHCHGVTGDGKGPTASFLNPYPRDFRLGTFKFKSTPRGTPPTDDDLHRVLMTGVEGTAMPSFRLLSDGERDALVNYVKYLSARGMVEQNLMLMTATELDPDGPFDTSPEFLVDDNLALVVGKWQSATPTEAPEPQVPLFTADRDDWSPGQESALQQSVQHGRELYYGNVANCYSCHGTTQLGDGQADDYDDWTKQLYDWAKEADEEGMLLSEYRSLDGLTPRPIRPRNLRDGQYRGGRRPLDIYWRIVNGIDGTPMPAATLKPPGAGPEAMGLTPGDIWDLVNYVLSLPYEPLSRPGLDEPTNRRLRL